MNQPYCCALNLNFIFCSCQLVLLCNGEFLKTRLQSMSKIQKKQIFNQCIYTLIKNRIDLHRLLL